MSILGPGHCDTCKWWGAERKHQDDMPVGTCRRTPPLLPVSQSLAYHDPERPDVPGPIVARGEWMWTAFDDWCAEHNFKPDDSDDTNLKRPTARL